MELKMDSYIKKHKEHPGDYKAFRKRVKSRLPEILATVIIGLLDDPPDLLNILGIGAGYGASDIPVLREISRKTDSKLNFHWVEPAGDYKPEFENNLVEAGLEGIVTTNYSITNLEELELPENSVDVAWAIHSLYCALKGDYDKNKENYQKDKEQVLKILNSLRPGGVGVVVLGTYEQNNTPLPVVLLDSPDWIIRNKKVNPRVFYYLLNKIGFNYKSIETASFWDITDCVNGEKQGVKYSLTNEGKKAVTYFLEKYNSYEDIPEKRRRKINDVLLNLAFVDKERLYIEIKNSIALFQKKE